MKPNEAQITAIARIVSENAAEYIRSHQAEYETFLLQEKLLKEQRKEAQHGKRTLQAR